MSEPHAYLTPRNWLEYRDGLWWAYTEDVTGIWGTGWKTQAQAVDCLERRRERQAAGFWR